MTCRDLSQPSFAEALVAGQTKRGGFLEVIDEAFDWKGIEVLLSPIHGSTKGAPGYPPLSMLKIILLQQCCTLSDPPRKPSGTACRSGAFAAFHSIGKRPTTLRSGVSGRRSTSSGCRRRCWGRPSALAEPIGKVVDAEVERAGREHDCHEPAN